MRLTRAIERYLEWMQAEEDATDATLASYAWLLWKLDGYLPHAQLHDLEGRGGTDKLRSFLSQWARLSSSTRANRISILHSFFDWLEAEDQIDANPARRIRRPPKRKPNIYRPTPAELALVRAAATLGEKPAILLMEGAGLRLTETRTMRWQNVDLLQGEVRLRRKGGDWRVLPLAPDVLAALRECYRLLDPDLDDHIYVAEVHRFDRPGHLAVTRKDPKQPASQQAVQRMLARVCKRAGVRPLTPHQLRHGFAKRFIGESDGDTRALQGLLSHARLETTEEYLDDIRLDELRAALERAHERRHGRRQEPDPGLVAAESQDCAWEDSNPRSDSEPEPPRSDSNFEGPDGPGNDPEGVSQSG
jgi:integrase/recombinase XerC